ncbi:hypothetical protein ACOMHN_023049 [Nucella lapillus]
MKSPVATKCDHYFCRFCLTEFLEKKRSVPCPLCKQPITKRSLKDKGELSSIVSTVGNLISAFQEDSGQTYSPPTGPQTFFPSTPDTISTKPESHLVKSRKNVRRSSSRSTKHADEESPSDVRGVDDSLFSDDRFAVPQVLPRTSGLKSARRRSNSATRISPSSGRAETGTSRQTRGRPRSTTRAATTAAVTAATDDGDTNDQLLQYLDENSCGLQKETQPDALSAQSTSSTAEQDRRDERTNSFHLGTKDGEAMADTEAEGCRITGTAETTELLQTAQVQNEASTSGREAVLTAENSLDDGEGRSLDKELSYNEKSRNKEQSDNEKSRNKEQSDDEKNQVTEQSEYEKRSENKPQSEANCPEKLSKRVARKNAKNLETRPETDKENLTESKKHPSSKRSNDEPKTPGLACSSQNSSDDSSVPSTQQFQLPLPVVRKTYGKRSSGRNVSDKVETWIACLPSSSKQKPDSDRNAEENSAGRCQQEAGEKEGRSAENVEDPGVTAQDMTMTENGEEEKDTRKEAYVQEGHEKSTIGTPEQYEEFMLTPPIRKKRIFKRKTAKTDQDSDSPTLPAGENSPPADPYFFVVGHTPVSKSKKRGRPRSKEKTGKPHFVNSFTLNTSEKKSVRFSDASSEKAPNTGLSLAESRKDQTQADNTDVESDPTGGVEHQQDIPPAGADSVIVCTESADGSPSPFIKPGTTRSRLRTRSKAQSTQKSSIGGTKEQRSTRRKVSNKKESPEAEKLREEQTEQLVSWIGQAEDHDLLFSTQEAQARIESMHTEETEETESVCEQNDTLHDENNTVNNDDGDDGAIALMEEDENSNDGVCLVGPIHAEKAPRTQSCQQEADLDIIAEERSHSGQNAADSNVPQLADPTELKPTRRGGNSMKSANSASGQNKHLTSLEPRNQGPSAHAVSLAESSPSGPRKKVDTVPETQLSTTESPASSSIVLPSPTAATALPKFSTPIIPPARQRSSKKGVHSGSEGEGVPKGSVPAEAHPKPNSRKRDTTAASVHPSALAPPAGDGDSDQSTIIPSQPYTPAAAVMKAKGKPASPSSALKLKRRSPSQKGEKATALRSSPSPGESPPGLPSRLRRQKRGSPSNSLPPVTAIPSTFTEDSPAAAACKEANEQQENHPGDIAEPWETEAQQRSSSRAEVQEDSEGSEAAGSLFSGTGKTGRSGRREHPSSHAGEAVTAGQETGDADPDDDDGGGSSSTEDLDIDPEQHEFEEPDFTLQSEEMQGRRFTRQDSQEDIAPQSFSSEAEVLSEIKSGLPFDAQKSPPETLKSVIDCSEQVKGDREADSTTAPEERHEQNRSTCFQEQNTDFDLNLDSAVDQLPQRLSSLTQIPETLETEEASGRTRSPPSDSTTQDVDGNTGCNDRQKSGKTVHTSSLTIGGSSSLSGSASPAQSPQLLFGPDKDGPRPDILTSSLNSDDQTSSASATQSQSILQPVRADKHTSSASTTPSQSILQPLRGCNQTSTPGTPSQSILQPVQVEKQSTIGVSEVYDQQQESAASSHNQLTAGQEVAENKHLDNPKHASRSERKLDGLPVQDSCQTLEDKLYEVGERPLADDQTLANDSGSSVQPDASERASPLADSEAMREHDDKKDHTGGEQVLDEGVQMVPKLLVQDTQNLQKTDSHSLPLLSQHVVQDSLPEGKEPSQASVGRENPRTSMRSVDSSPNLEQTCSSLSLKSPALSEGNNLKRDNMDSSPSLVSSGRKRKLDRNSENAKGTCHLPSDELLSMKSPSGGPSKVISSAPPRATLQASDSDEDDDAVLIVRRTKRKCFSLGGSPVERTPLSVKRRRFRGKQRNLSEAFSKEADRGAQQSLQELSQASGASKGDRLSENTQLPSLADEVKYSCTEEGNHGVDATSNEGPETAERLRETAGTEGVKLTATTPKTSPLYPRRKTVRGLARQKESPDLVTDTVCGHDTTRTLAFETAEKSEPGIQTDSNTLQADPSACDARKGQLSKKRRVLVQISDNDDDDDEPMEVDFAASEDSGRKTLLQANLQDRTQGCPSRVASERSRPIEEEAPVIVHESDKSITITQSSDKSREQEWQPVTQTSVSASLDDATIPPPSFDLRFDDSDEEDHNIDSASLLEQSPQKTTDHEPKKSKDAAHHADSHGKRSLDAKSQQKEQRHGTSVGNKTEGRETAVSAETLRKDEEVKVPASCQEELHSSGESKKCTPSSEEEPIVGLKKKRTAVIDSDSDDSDQGSDDGAADSEASMQLNFTSSSAVSSQSEILTTQERSKMESELERLRREICEMESKLQAQSSSRSDSNGDRNQDSVKSQATSGMASDGDSSQDEGEKISEAKRKKRGKTHKSSIRDEPASRIKRPRRRQRISSDEDEAEAEDSRQPRQKLMDSYLSTVRGEPENAATDQAKGPPSPLSVPPQGNTKGGRPSPVISDEDSSDLFLSPLSPSPPPPTKHSLARGEPYRPPQPLFSGDSPSVTGTRSKFRQSLDFAKNVTEQKHSVDDASDDNDVNKDNDDNDANELNNSQPDSQESSMSGEVNKIPESQFSVSGGSKHAQRSDSERSQQGSERVLRENATSSMVDGADDVESSGSPLPSPLSEAVLEEGENKENVDEEEEVDDEDLPRWKRKKLGFISSGLDQEKLGCLRQLAETNECKVYSKFNDYVTHVIIKTEKNSRVCERTLKYFQGAACQCWVLSYDWVLQCLAQGRFVSEKRFEIQGDTVKGDNHGGPRLSRLSSARLLEGFAFASVGVSSDMSKKELTQLLTQSGAEVVDDPWALAGHCAAHRLVLRCVDSEAKPPTPAEVELFDGQYKHFGLVTVAREWILDSVCTHCLQPLREYVFNTCPNLQLPF